MPVEGFDGASKKIKQSAVQRRKAARDANNAKSRKIRDAADKAKAQKIKKQKETNAKNDSDFSKYASKYEQNRLDANRTFRAGGSKRKFIEGVVARGRAAEAAKAKVAKPKADGNIAKTVTPKPKTKVTPKPETKVKAPAVKKPVAKKPVAKTPAAKAKAPAAKAPKAANTGFTSAMDRIKAKGVRSLGTYNKPTEIKKALEVTKKGSYNFNEGTGPNTSVFDKTKNVAPKTEEKAPKKPRDRSDKTAMRGYEKQMRDYKRKTSESANTGDKPMRKKRAAKGSRAATLKKGFGY